MNFRLVLPLTLCIVALTGCANYRAGDCVQNIDDGYIWRITEVHLRQYTVQGWQDQDGAWGLPGELLFRVIDSAYVQIPCPFSTEVIEDQQIF